VSALPEDDVTGSGAMHSAPGGRWRLLRWLADTFAGPVAPDAAPERIGRYRVLRMLGEGGMGRVFLAEDEGLRRQVAVKMLKALDRKSIKRFLREAQAAARISHPHVCPIFEVGQEGRAPFIAMELLAGETLAGRLQRGALPVREAVDTTLQVLSALQTLHDAAIVHRDVKPSNVFLTAHGARLLDFGLARELPKDLTRAFHSPADTSRTGIIMGTPGYMAPEQILGQSVDPRADLFATAALLYEALTGRRPFDGDSAVRMLSAALYEEPLPLTGSPAIEMLDVPIRRGLSKQPDQRYRSAGEMAQALRTAAQAADSETSLGAPARDVFVGRHYELVALQERLAAAMAGSGSVVFVTGERGVGKSTLVAEFLRRVHKSLPAAVTVLAGRCVEPQGPGEAFLPFLDAVGRILGGPGGPRTAELIRTWAPAGAYSWGLLPDSDGSFQRQAVGATKERLIREAGDLLAAASRDFPTVFYLEDLQWADAASVELLHHVGCRVARQRTLIVGTYRHAEVDAANAPFKRCALDLVARGVGREFTLGALSSDDIQSYLDTRFPVNGFPESLARTVHARTEGLALFVRSLVDLLVDRGEIVRDEKTGWRLARPVEELDLEPTKGLQELVRHHLETLPEEERRILQNASVCGREFLSTVVADILDAEAVEVEERLRSLCETRRLILDRGEEELPDGTLATRYRFGHGLYQSVLYQDLVASRRIQLHASVAGRLRHHWGREGPRLGAEIAQHCEQGRDFPGAVTSRIHAGDNAARLFAYAEAARHYDWAERLLEKLPDEDRLAHELRLLERRGALRHSQAQFDEAADDLRAMLAKARQARRTDDERSALTSLCDTLFYARRVDEMALRAGELLAVAGRTGRDADITEARSRMGQVLACEGRFGEAAPLLDEVIVVARAGGPPSALQTGLAFRGLVHYWRAEYEDSERLFAEGANVATSRGDAFYATVLQMFVALSRVHLGRVSAGLRVLDETIDVAGRNGDRFWLPRLYSQKGMAHREMLAFEKAREFDAEGLRLAQQRPLAWGPETDALLNLVVDDVRVGRTQRVESLLAEIEARSAASDWLRWMNELRVLTAASEHWAARGSWERAAETASRLAAHARGLGARGYVCTAVRIQAESALAREQTTDLASHAGHLAEAVEALRSFPAPFETWKARRVLGLARQRLGDDQAARAARAEAARDVRAIAGNVDDPELRDTFLQAPPVREVLEDATPA
jgi:tetratricopeptide (TPR) repeat protein